VVVCLAKKVGEEEQEAACRRAVATKAAGICRATLRDAAVGEALPVWSSIRQEREGRWRARNERGTEARQRSGES